MNSSHQAPDGNPAEKGGPTELDQRIAEFEEGIERRVRAAELEIASRRSYEKVVVLLGYAVIAGVALLGILGYNSITDIGANLEENVTKKISNFDSKTNATLGKFRDYDREVVKLTESLRDAEKQWEVTIKPAIEGLAKYDPDADLYGRYLEIFKQDDAPRNEPEWRSQATGLLSSIIEHIENKDGDVGFVAQFSANDIFNLAQETRRIGRNDLGYKLTQAAYNARPSSAAARSLYLSLG